MKKIPFVNSRFDTERGLQLEDGRVIPMYENGKMIINFATRLDLVNGTYCDYGETAPDGVETTTFNDLIADGKGKEVFCYDEVEFYRDIYPSSLRDEKKQESIINQALQFFKDNNAEVSRDAIEHNLYAWLGDYKSGYRDEAHGCHLFTPCGHNPLSFRRTQLRDLCEDWQITYFC